VAWQSYAEAAVTSAGFFWKAGWAFVLGYFVSGMIRAFVPKAGLTRRMGDAGPRSVALAGAFGAASSSCSFAALATARALVLKGVHFVAAVTFMFASTNLVIELGILIVIFLGWPFLAAELLGGVIMIAISSLLISATCPPAWMEAARARAERGAGEQEEDFDWRRRIRSREGWRLAGNAFVDDWKMVWEEIVIGFTVAGFMAVLVPDWLWAAIFVGDHSAQGIGAMLENVLVAPLVAASTFIGSMGNIPLATVLGSRGVQFAGIMAFIYSDLMVPPLVVINARYYGWRMALYIAGVMYVTIVATAMLLGAGFAASGLTPESARRMHDVSRFAVDYTLWLNLLFAVVALVAVRLHREHVRSNGRAPSEGGMGTWGFKRVLALLCLALVAVGAAARLFL